MTPSNEKAAGGGAVELKPCPFCTGRASQECESDADYPQKKFMFVRCTRCGAKTAAIYGSGDPSEWADARHNWNTRTDAESALKLQADRIAELEGALERIWQGSNASWIRREARAVRSKTA